MISAFWKEAYAKFFEGSNLLIPILNPHIELSVYPIFSRIISHAYLIAGYLPVHTTLPTLINILLGPKPLFSRILLEVFVDYVSAQERLLIKEALSLRTASKFSDNIKQKVLNILSRFGCRQLPTPANLTGCIEDIACILKRVCIATTIAH